MKLLTILENENIILQPLQEQDFERLYNVASDPKIWEQHPNPDRWKKEVFTKFFQEGMESQGAYIILDKATNEVIGSSRFYNHDEKDNSIFIGYTFYGTKFWGTGVNAQVKKMMLDYIFQYVDLVKFYAGENNYRSKKALEKLGATLKGNVVASYKGEPDRNNVEYDITKEDWQKKA